MIIERPQAPTRKNLAKVRLLKTKRETAECELVDSGVIFTLPIALIPAGIADGDTFALKTFDPFAEEENHTLFAQRLLEDIMG